MALPLQRYGPGFIDCFLNQNDSFEKWHSSAQDNSIEDVNSCQMVMQGSEMPSSPSKYESRSVMSSSLQTHGQCSPTDSPGQNTGMSSHSLLQRIFSTQGSNPGLPHCRQILYQLSHYGSPRMLEWIAVSFSRGSS